MTAVAFVSSMDHDQTEKKSVSLFLDLNFIMMKQPQVAVNVNFY